MTEDIFVATIIGQHHSTHSDEGQAIQALQKAEQETGLQGHVEAYGESGTFRSRTVVYPKVGPTWEWTE